MEALISAKDVELAAKDVGIRTLKDVIATGTQRAAPALKFGEPEKFSGSKRQQNVVDSFVEACETVFSQRPDLSEENKIRYAISKSEAGSQATLWSRPLLAQFQDTTLETPAAMRTWSAFAQAFNTTFGDPL